MGEGGGPDIPTKAIGPIYYYFLFYYWHGLESADGGMDDEDFSHLGLGSRSRYPAVGTRNLASVWDPIPIPIPPHIARGQSHLMVVTRLRSANGEAKRGTMVDMW